MKQLTKIYLVRHGESVANRDGILAGHLDSILTPEGKTQAGATKAKLKSIHFDSAYSSDLSRAVETAEIIVGKPLEPSQKLFGLRERTFGSLEGMPGEHLHKLIEEHQGHFDSLPKHERWAYKFAPDMESNADLTNRFMKALEEVAKQNQGKTILVVTHGGCIRSTLITLGYRTEEQLPPRSFRNAGYAELSYDGQKFKVINAVGINKN